MLIGALAGQSLGVATAVFLYLTFASPLFVIWVFCASGVRWTDILEIYMCPFIIGALAAGASLGISRRVGAAGWPPMTQLAAGLCVGLLLAIIGRTLRYAGNVARNCD